MKKTILLIALVILANLSTFAQTFPYGINYQAVARDANGNAQVNQPTPLRFTIYKTSATGTIVWQETQTATTNSIGQFNAIIGNGLSTGAGSLGSFSAINWSNDNYYLKVELQTGISTFVAMGPTTQFQSVPYALTAPDPTPAGVISAYGGTIAPSGYLLCQGQAVSRTGIYAKLYNAIGISYGWGDGSTTFNVPDFRGMFLRGVDGGTGNDPDAATRTATNNGSSQNNVGSKQDDSFQGHGHNLIRTSDNSPAGTNTGTQGSSAGSGVLIAGSIPVIASTPIELNGNGIPRLSSETRPKNVYVNYIIKY